MGRGKAAAAGPKKRKRAPGDEEAWQPDWAGAEEELRARARAALLQAADRGRGKEQASSTPCLCAQVQQVAGSLVHEQEAPGKRAGEAIAASKPSTQARPGSEPSSCRSRQQRSARCRLCRRTTRPRPPGSSGLARCLPCSRCAAGSRAPGSAWLASSAALQTEDAELRRQESAECKHALVQSQADRLGRWCAAPRTARAHVRRWRPGAATCRFRKESAIAASERDLTALAQQYKFAQ